MTEGLWPPISSGHGGPTPIVLIGGIWRLFGCTGRPICRYLARSARWSAASLLNSATAAFTSFASPYWIFVRSFLDLLRHGLEILALRFHGSLIGRQFLIEADEHRLALFLALLVLRDPNGKDNHADE